MIKNKNQTITDKESIHDAVKKLDEHKLNTLIILNKKKKVTVTFTMGDFRRAIFVGLDINDAISLIVNKNYEYLTEGYSKTDVKQKFIKNNLVLDIPVVNKNFQLLEIVRRINFFTQKELKKKDVNLYNFPVVIMAGGKGTRLDPVTRILPKPLIPYGNNPIIRVIMDYFKKFNCNKFYLSVNEKGNMIKTYFNDLKRMYKISYIEENKPLGTAGSLKLLKNKLKKTFFVTNCDVLIQTDYPALMRFHKENKYDLTIVSSFRKYKVPYGVCNFNQNGDLLSINEKPEYSFFLNTGLYVLDPKVLEIIPRNIKFDMDKLISEAKKKNMKIGVFPVSESSWIDLGQWSEYKKNMQL